MAGPRNNGSGGGGVPTANSMGFGQETKARLFLALACLWPLWVLALFGASSSSNANAGGVGVGVGVTDPSAAMAASQQHGSNRYNLRNVLDRVDIMGYGPTHPRVAVVVIGGDSGGDQDGGGDGPPETSMKESIESVFGNTDLQRLFVIVGVMDGFPEDPKLVQDLVHMDLGSIPHWHGLRLDIHAAAADKHPGGGEDAHGRKIHTMFHPERVGLAAARMEAVEFIQVLEEKHIQAGLKSREEDLIIVFLQSGARLTDSKWLQPVTNALIVPPPILARDADEAVVASKLANAVSLRVEAPGRVTSFDSKLMPLLEARAKAADINLSSGDSYPTPAFNGMGIAMRLHTYVNLPAQDLSLMDPWATNLELSLNLWLCADGIDILQEVEVTTPPPAMDALLLSSTTPLDTDVVARFGAVWMDEATMAKFFRNYNAAHITRLDWETKVQRAQNAPDFPKEEVVRRCRSLEWYAQEVNTNLQVIFEPGNSGWQKTEEELVQKGGTVSKEELAPVVEAAAAKAVQEPLKSRLVESEEVAPEEHHEPPPEEQQHFEPPPVQEEGHQGALEADNRKKPKVPLRKENLGIVQKAKPMDISFVPVDGGHKDHPHMGAKDEDGNWGYIHDETALHSNPPPLTWDEGQEAQACQSRDNNFRMMTERIVVETEYEEQQKKAGAKRDKIFCLVYTIESGHPRIPNIRETWGPKCDGFMVGSNKTDKALGTVELPHEGPEEYNNIWQKVRTMWSYIYDNYYEKYDWFHIGGDDLFLLVENLRYYLESEEIRTASNGGIYLPTGNETMQTPLLLGRRFAMNGRMDEIFDSGGSGYTMNKAAFKLLVTEGLPNYFPHAHTFSEDTMSAKIFRKLGVVPYDTKDEDGGERYMPFAPGHHWRYRLPANPASDWYARYSIDIKEGPEHCSPQSLAFHYVKDIMMKRLFALAYGLCPDKYMKQ